ncbi:hypothetical protein NPIL_654231 [Nephila pilipes]|uniref:Uncharacterized protein n=1 Tax=Nephila pilipes TaxID=299642 RepID=A0A8X6TGU6_NEPPI|nr:hypothetical protein NPIL_654231 [Nephila pilipes]
MQSVQKAADFSRRQLVLWNYDRQVFSGRRCSTESPAFRFLCTREGEGEGKTIEFERKREMRWGSFKVLLEKHPPEVPMDLFSSFKKKSARHLILLQR